MGIIIRKGVYPNVVTVIRLPLISPGLSAPQSSLTIRFHDIVHVEVVLLTRIH